MTIEQKRFYRRERMKAESQLIPCYACQHRFFCLTKENERLKAQLQSLEDFKPTPQQVNALPKGIRHYVMLIETRCDPSGDLREAVLAKDIIEELCAKVRDLESQLENLERKGRY